MNQFEIEAYDGNGDLADSMEATIENIGKKVQYLLADYDEVIVRKI